jgi:hypothetical protein
MSKLDGFPTAVYIIPRTHSFITPRLRMKDGDLGTLASILIDPCL